MVNRILMGISSNVDFVSNQILLSYHHKYIIIIILFLFNFLLEMVSSLSTIEL